MIKLIGTGVWVCLVTLSSVYFSVQVANREPAVDEIPPMFGGLETVRGEITSVPVIADGGVQGYFLTRLSYTVSPGQVTKLSVPADQLVTDALYSELVGNRSIDVGNLDNFDLPAFKEQIRTALNERIGKEIFHDIIVEQIDFISKEDIRANMKKGNPSVTGKMKPVGEAPTH